MKRPHVTLKSTLLMCLWYANVCYCANPVNASECFSIDVRNDCNELLKLENCTVIKGSLYISLLPERSEQLNGSCDYSKYSFPLLREITDHLVFFDVKALNVLGTLFPNLVVIRGRRLFLNYALGVTAMPDLQRLDLASLLAIQRGHVFIGSSQKLCHLDKVDWDRLTISPGENHIYPAAICESSTNCQNCRSDHCWSEGVCQVWENERSARDCHQECLGGCYNNTESGCYVCKRLTDHGACVETCPHDKFLHEHFQRCYTKDECTRSLGRYIHEGSCVSKCPTGHAANQSKICVPCKQGESCIEICQASSKDLITIFNMADTNYIKGCQIINATLIIAFKNKINEAELKMKFQNLREIRGHLKISRNPFLTSLDFLENLEKISANPPENNMYGLIVYGNKNLESLWQPKNLTIENAGVYIHLNNKLCNHHLSQFQKQIKHDKKLDSLQLNDQDVLCGEATLDVQITDVTHKSFRISWLVNQTSEKVELIYRTFALGELAAHLDVDVDICSKTLWTRRLYFKSDIFANSTHHSYIFNDLQADTRYGFSIKTFGEDYVNDSRSGVHYVTTEETLLMPPVVNVIANTNDSIEIDIKMPNTVDELRVKYYKLHVYERKSINLKQLSSRNYCQQPIALEPLDEQGDFDNCCLRMANDQKLAQFKRNIYSEFKCEKSTGPNCSADLMSDKPYRSLRIEMNETRIVLVDLKSSHLYIVHTHACNSLGCGLYDMAVVRTGASMHEGLGDLAACHNNATNEYRVHFKEPNASSNDIIVSYLIHYRDYISANTTYKRRMACITPLQHAQSHFVYVSHYKSSFTEVAVSVTSLAGTVHSNWTAIEPCENVISVHPPESAHSNTINLFVVCFLLGAIGTLLWLCYKYKYWRKFNLVWNWIRFRFIVLTHRNAHDDREVLVENFESVRFHNTDY